MVFPFAVRFNRILQAEISSEQRNVALEYIKTRISERSANNIIIENNTITYNGSTSHWRGTLFGGVDGGTFSLINNNNMSYLTYEIRMRKLFIATGIMSVFMGIVSRLWFVGFGAFLWLCGANFITYVIRHGGLVSEMVIGINDLFFEKDKKTEEPAKDESLKSWM